MGVLQGRVIPWLGGEANNYAESKIGPFDVENDSGQRAKTRLQSTSTDSSFSHSTIFA